jgi:hypothetical protein
MIAWEFLHGVGDADCFALGEGVQIGWLEAFGEGPAIVEEGGIDLSFCHGHHLVYITVS